MAELGVTRSDNDGGLHSNSGWIWACPIPAANVPGGALTQIEVWINDGGPSNQYRLLVYQGGVSTSDPTGNTLLWDSGELNCEGASFEWIATAISDVEFAANEILWVCVVNNGSAWVGRAPTDGSEDGDFIANTWRMSDALTPSQTPPSSLGGIAGTAYTDPLKILLTYTEAAGGSSVGLLQQMHYYYS